MVDAIVPEAREELRSGCTRKQQQSKCRFESCLHHNPKNPFSMQQADHVKTQTQQILAALQAGEKLTPMDALNRFGCLRLGARIWDLRKEGYTIVSENYQTVSGKHVARYSLVLGSKPKSDDTTNA